jgi:hypothetical protein
VNLAATMLDPRRAQPLGLDPDSLGLLFDSLCERLSAADFERAIHLLTSAMTPQHRLVRPCHN